MAQPQTLSPNFFKKLGEGVERTELKKPVEEVSKTSKLDRRKPKRRCLLQSPRETIRGRPTREAEQTEHETGEDSGKVHHPDLDVG